MRLCNNAWKKVVFVILAVLLVSQPSWGQYRGRRRGGLADGDHYHFGYVSGHVGYSILDSHSKGVMPAGNVAGGFGVGYEYRNSGLWANVGIQMSFHRSRLKLDPYTIEHEGVMPNSRYNSATGLWEGQSGKYLYQVQQTDKIEWNFFDVPILFGYYTHGFHLGAGIKLSYALKAKSKTEGSFDLQFSPDAYGIYNQPTVYADKPDRGLTNYPFKVDQDNRINVGASLIGEIGYDLLSSVPTNSRLCNVLKLSFYFEYGLNNFNKGGDKDRFELPAPNESHIAPAKDVKFNSFLNTEASPARTVPFFAGAKLTYLIGGSKTARAGGFHRGCMCYN